MMACENTGTSFVLFVFLGGFYDKDYSMLRYSRDTPIWVFGKYPYYLSY